MAGIVAKRQPTSQELLAWHAEQPSRVFETAGGVTYDPWQRHILRNGSQFILGDKSRRIGFTFDVCDKLLMSGLLRVHEGHQATIISISQDDAEGCISYVQARHDSLPPRFRYPLIGESRTELRMAHPNGKIWEIKAHPNRAARSRGGDVFWDEAAHGKNDRAVFAGTLACVAVDPRDQFIVGSTPFAKRGIFYDLVRKADGRYLNWDRYFLPWWHCPRLCVDCPAAEVEAPLLSTRERVERFGTPTLRAIYESYPDEESFRVEFELEWMEALSALFDPELMDSLTEPDWGDHGELPCKVCEGAPTELDWRWLAASKKGVLFGGFDVGRRRNESVLAIWDMADLRRELRMLVRLPKTAFEVQEEVLAASCQKADVLRTYIDQTGIGEQLSERMAKAFPGRFAGVILTQQVKDALATKIHIACTARERQVWLPRYRPLVMHFLSIKKEVSSAGKIIYSVALNEQAEGSGHHADIFWACALGLDAANIRTWSVSDIRAGDYQPETTGRGVFGV